MKITSEMETHQPYLTDMEFHIHHVETEAYGAVLRAFIAQSDVLSWGKEALISELRKELRVSDVEHREILAKVNADRSVKTLTKLPKDADLHEEQLTIPRKRLKSAHATLSSSPRHPAYVQPSVGAVPSPMVDIRDEQWNNGRGVVVSQVNTRQVVNSVPYSEQRSTAGNGKGSMIPRSSRKVSIYSGGNTLKSGHHTIQIRATEKLVHEVEKACGGKNPDPHQVERAKLILGEHERALIEAIAKLSDVPDEDISLDPRHQATSYEEPKSNEHGFNNMVCESVDGLGSYYNRR